MRTSLLTLLLTLSSFLAFSQGNLDSMLIAYYPFNGNANNIALNIFNGTPFDVTPTTDRNGVQGSAYFYNGDSAAIEFPTDFDFPEKTVSFWFEAHSISVGLRGLFDCDHPGLIYGKTGFSLGIDQGDTILYYRRGPIPTTRFDLINQVQTNEWYMATTVISGDTSKYYFNDSLVFSTGDGFSTSASGNPFASLGKSRINDRFFHGKIDDLRVYSRALSDSEVQELFLDEGYYGPSALANSSIKEKVRVYPNPAKDLVQVESQKGSYLISIWVLDILGNTVMEFNPNGVRNLSLDVKSISRGAYFLRINTSAGTTTQKVILK